MRTTIEYLDAVKARLDLPSDYAAAKVLGISRSAVSKYRLGQAHFDAEVAARVASILEIDAIEVLASAEFERARSDVAREIWGGLLEKISKGFRTLVQHANACGAMVPQV